MKSTTALALLGSFLCVATPAEADQARAQQPAPSAGASVQPHELSSRHRHWRGGHAVVVRRLAPPYTHAPIPHKVFGDPRWPYVHWFGSPDSLYVAGPLVTFVRYY